jgi:hypothetical protein
MDMSEVLLCGIEGYEATRVLCLRRSANALAASAPTTTAATAEMSCPGVSGAGGGEVGWGDATAAGSSKDW